MQSPLTNQVLEGWSSETTIAARVQGRAAGREGGGGKEREKGGGGRGDAPAHGEILNRKLGDGGLEAEIALGGGVKGEVGGGGIETAAEVASYTRTHDATFLVSTPLSSGLRELVVGSVGTAAPGNKLRN